MTMRPPARIWLVGVAAAAAILVAGTQDPQRAAVPVAPVAPPDSEPLPPVPDPPWLAVTRHDLLQRFTPEGPLEGTWRLRNAVRDGRALGGAHGHLIAGPRILMFQLRLPEPSGGFAVQASTRGYRIADGRLETETLHGHDTFGGQLHAEPTGRVELRRLEFVGGVVRIARDGANFIEFERLE